MLSSSFSRLFLTTALSFLIISPICAMDDFVDGKPIPPAPQVPLQNKDGAEAHMENLTEEQAKVLSRVKNLSEKLEIENIPESVKQLIKAGFEKDAASSLVLKMYNILDTKESRQDFIGRV